MTFSAAHKIALGFPRMVLATFHIIIIKLGRSGESLLLARRILDDPHDLSHKAVDRMLREVGKRDRAAAAAFMPCADTIRQSRPSTFSRCPPTSAKAGAPVHRAAASRRSVAASAFRRGRRWSAP